MSSELKEVEEASDRSVPLPKGTSRRKEKMGYRVNGERFLIYDCYMPKKVIGLSVFTMVIIEALDVTSNELVAIKKNKGVFNSLTDARRLLRELKLLQHFEHCNILSVTGVITPEPMERDEFNEVYLVMPRMQTTLAKVIRGKCVLSTKHIQYFLFQLLRGLFHLHSAGVFHGDLKPENILVNGSDCRLKIADFGLVRDLRADDIKPRIYGRNDCHAEYVVPRWYRAPETLCSSRPYDSLMDVWSVGCILAEFWNHKPLLRGSNPIEQLKQIFHYRGIPTDTTWITTPDAHRWVESLRPKEPVPWSEVLPGIGEAASDVLSRMLELNPTRRCSVEDALRHSWLSALFQKSALRKAKRFDTAFESDPRIESLFGVRQMIYEELTQFSEKREAKLRRRRRRYESSLHRSASD